MSRPQTARRQRSATKTDIGGAGTLRPCLRRAAGARAWLALIAAIATIAIQFAAAEPAAASGGLDLQRTATSSLLVHDEVQKMATATCPSGKLVVGGGGAIWSQKPGETNNARLTALIPTRTTFVAEAETQFLTGGPDWRVDAYAVCADAKALGDKAGKYRIVPAGNSKEQERNKFKTAEARCPAGTVAYGTGAFVPSNGRIGLQMTRTSTPLDISRATGRADDAYRPDPRDPPWVVTSYAICAQPAGGLHFDAELGPGNGLVHQCSNRSQVVAGPGGGGGLNDGGQVWLKSLYPHADNDVLVQMTGLFSDRQVLASPTCADRS